MNHKKALEICRKCKATCCKMGGADFTKKEMERVLKAGYKNCFRRIGDNDYELKSKKGICPYLSKNYSCTIHRVRPAMCKCWPVYLDYKNDKKSYILIDCPLTPFLSKKDISEMKKQADCIPKELVCGAFSRSQLSKSDLRLITKRFNRFKRKSLK